MRPQRKIIPGNNFGPPAWTLQGLKSPEQPEEIFDPSSRAEVLREKARADAERERLERAGAAALKVLDHPDASEEDRKAAQIALEASNLYATGSIHAARTKAAAIG